ncbi:MAG: hypothetical protein E2O39_05070 [Planctomycetota bacterium]|nr:MAG: hypothetical protein E2O39_05070 [Planctomycetota bacterium]
MISVFLLLPTLLPAAPHAVLAPALVRALGDEAYEERLARAGEDPEKLWELVIWCESTERDKEARTVLRRLVKLEPGHRRAHEKLGHVEHEDRWFPTRKKLESYLAKEKVRRAEAAGLVKFKGEWVQPEELPYLKRGLVRDDLGLWITKREYRWLSQGYVRQDLRWIPPAEIPQIAAGLWKCGDDWLPLDEANRFHADVDHMWRIPGRNLIVRTTCDRGIALRAIREMEGACDDLARIYGREPTNSIEVTVLRSAKQYDRFAAGRAGTSVPQTDITGLAARHHAFFTEGWVDVEADKYEGMGASFWDDSTEIKTRYGVCSVRHAVGLSFVEALDPSPKAIERALKIASHARGKGPLLDAAWVAVFLAEKRIPRWFRYGAASYVERYYHDNSVGGGDPWWTRKWSTENITSSRGLDTLDTIFEFELDDAGRESKHLLNEVGLVVAFVLDGDCKPVQERHEILMETIRKGEDPRSAFQALEEAIAKADDDLLEFAGL